MIIPAYNEEKRSANFIPILIDFVKKHLKDTEIIIVDDGSRDNTKWKIKKIIKSKKASSFVRIIGYSTNKGKGSAVAYGVKAAKGSKILFIDADGAINPDQIPAMLKKLDEYDFVAGDRRSARSRIKTTLLRKITSFGFNMWVSLLFQYSYRDNLCGFKGFRRNIAKTLFSDLVDKRWIFDVELFFKAKKKKYSIYFLPIKWHYVGGSRIKMFIDPILWFLRLITLRYQLRNYH